jgi:hypothetical protein
MHTVIEFVCNTCESIGPVRLLAGIFLYFALLCVYTATKWAIARRK